jgi:protein-disulfide isomerase
MALTNGCIQQRHTISFILKWLRRHLFIVGLIVIICSLFPLLRVRSRGPANAAVENRRIEVLIRSQYNVPSDYDVILGTPKKSAFSGYDDLPVAFGYGQQRVDFTFLLSRDRTRLARVQTSDLANEPWKTIPLGTAPTRGDGSARVTIINFDDLACPYSARIHKLLSTELGAYKTLVRVAYKEYPLVSLHPWAMHAAVDARCLAAQDTNAYWSYVDYVHSRFADINAKGENLSQSFQALDVIAQKAAKAHKLDMIALAGCLAKQDESKIRETLAKGEELSIDGTPTLFIDGERINGAHSKTWVLAAVNRALRYKGITPPEITPDSNKSGDFGEQTGTCGVN